nr:hypothetical protein 33 [bacterium]
MPKKRKYNLSPEKREERAARMKKLNADPEFKAKQAAAASARMKKLHADPEFNPLAALTPQQREDYDILKKNGYTRADALEAVGWEG